MALTRKEIARRKELGAARATIRHILGAEMMRRGYNGRRLARELGCSDGIVSDVLRGHKHSPRVLGGLRNIGVPEYLLYDPRYMEPLPHVNSKNLEAI
jgi:hypothetical protein